VEVGEGGVDQWELPVKQKTNRPNERPGGWGSFEGVIGVEKTKKE